MSRVKTVNNIKNYSGYDVYSHKGIPHLKEKNYVQLNKAVTGDAPKDILAIYKYKCGVNRNSNKWPEYIAKVGHKWYPNESITEQLFTSMGNLLELNIADSCLYFVHNQIRFCSKSFLAEDYKLTHGAEILARYLSDDKDFVDEIEEKKETQSIISFSDILSAIKDVYPDQYQELSEGFVRMLAFDAIIGNNDRHHYNWGIVQHIKRKNEVKFSPIFDTARGLFWNVSEENLDKHFGTKLIKYIENCIPKTGWDTNKINHFELIGKIFQEKSEFQCIVQEVYDKNLCEKVKILLYNEFNLLFSEKRKKKILECLKQRMQYYYQIIT